MTTRGFLCVSEANMWPESIGLLVFIIALVCGLPIANAALITVGLSLAQYLLIKD